MVSMVAALAIGCGSKKEGGSEKNEGTTEKTKYEQIMEKGVLTIGFDLPFLCMGNKRNTFACTVVCCFLWTT